jgi:hypothetical protein
MFYDISQSEIEALLCRTLTSCEAAAFDLYLENSKEILESVLCGTLENTDCEVRYYDFEQDDFIQTDVFTELCSLSIEDCELDEAILLDCQVRAQLNDQYNSKFYNNIDICEKNSCGCPKDICVCNSTCKRWKVEAKWGYGEDKFLRNLLVLLIKEEVLNSDCNENVKSKSIEGYSVTFKSDTEKVKILDKYAKQLDKYNVCRASRIRGV